MGRGMKPLIQWSGTHRILIADDEPDIHAVTRLSLKALSRKIGNVEFVSASTGKETLAMLQQHPDIGVILLDVVMETDTAGLDACRAPSFRRPLSRPARRRRFRGAPEIQRFRHHRQLGELALEKAAVTLHELALTRQLLFEFAYPGVGVHAGQFRLLSAPVAW